MKRDIKQETVEYISTYIHNFPLSESICRAIETGLHRQWVHFAGGNTVWEVFKQSLDAAIKDIEDDPRGILFKRLIRYGPHFDTEPHAPKSDDLLHAPARAIPVRTQNQACHPAV